MVVTDVIFNSLGERLEEFYSLLLVYRGSICYMFLCPQFSLLSPGLSYTPQKFIMIIYIIKEGKVAKIGSYLVNSWKIYTDSYIHRISHPQKSHRAHLFIHKYLLSSYCEKCVKRPWDSKCAWPVQEWQRSHYGWSSEQGGQQSKGME